MATSHLVCAIHFLTSIDECIKPSVNKSQSQIGDWGKTKQKKKKMNNKNHGGEGKKERKKAIETDTERVKPPQAGRGRERCKERDGERMKLKRLFRINEITKREAFDKSSG